MPGETMNYKTGLIITGDASGGIKAVRATEEELKKLNTRFEGTGKQSRQFASELKQSNSELDLMSGFAKSAALSIGGLLVAGGVGGFFAGAIEEAEKLQRNLLRTEQLIVTTGGAAGFSAKQLHDQARELALATLQSTEGIMSAQQVLLSYSNIAGENFTRAIETATDLSSLIDGNLNTSLEMLAKTLDNPIKGINAMSKQGIYFSESQQNVIKSLVETNRLAEAQTIILDELAGQFGGVAVAEALRFGGAQDTLAQRIQEAKIEFAEQLQLLKRSQELYTTLADGVVTVTENMDTLISVGQILAIAMGGKLAGSLSAVVAVKIAAQAQSIRYQATLASMAGVSASAAASQVALASSIALANRAMMMLGGPVGIAVIAAGSMYAFRNELGLTKTTSELTTEGLSQVSHSIKTMDGAIINNNLDQLGNDLQEVSLRATEARLRVSQLQTQLSAFSSSGGDISDGSNMGAGHARQWSAEASRIASNLAAARQQVEAEEALIYKINESIDRLNNSPRRNGKTSADSIQEISKEAKRLAEQGANYLKELARMRATDLQNIENWKQDSIEKLRSYNLSVQQIKDGEAMIIAEANQRVIDLENKKWDGFLDKSLSSLAKLRAEAEMLEGPKGQLVQRSIGQQIATETFSGLPGESYLAPEVGGASGEIARLERERLLILEAYNQRIEDYKLYREMELENKEIYDEQIIALEAQKNSILDSADKAIADAKLKRGAETFSALSGLARAFGGEQSKAYRVLYGIQQGYTLASILLSSAEAIGKAWASAPFPANLPAVAITIAETGALQQMVSGISSPSFNGGGQTWQGPRSGGVDGIGGQYAIVHSDETIIDHTKPVPEHLKQVLLERVFNNDITNYIEGPNSSASIANNYDRSIMMSGFSRSFAQQNINNSSNLLTKSINNNRRDDYTNSVSNNFSNYSEADNSINSNALTQPVLSNSFVNNSNSTTSTVSDISKSIAQRVVNSNISNLLAQSTYNQQRSAFSNSVSNNAFSESNSINSNPVSEILEMSFTDSVNQFLTKAGDSRTVNQIDSSRSMIDGRNTANTNISSISQGLAQRINNSNSISTLLNQLTVNDESDSLISYSSNTTNRTANQPKSLTTSIANMIANNAIETYYGGGYTGKGARVGGVDGIGGRLAVIHSDEIIIDLTKPLPDQLQTMLVNNSVPNVNNEISFASQQFLERRDDIERLNDSSLAFSNNMLAVKPQTIDLPSSNQQPSVKNEVIVKINVIESQDRAGQMEERGSDEEREIDLFVSDVFGDGRRSQALQQVFGLTRQGF